MQMKKFMRVTCMVLALLMTFLFCACDGGAGNGGTTGTDGSGTTGTTAGTTTATQTTTSTTETTTGSGEGDVTPGLITPAMLADMRIVYPSSMFSGSNRDSGTVWSAIETLQSSIKRYFNVEVAMNSDVIKANSSKFQEVEYEILIGDVATREESSQVMTDLGLKDYGYEMVGTKIVIKGGSYTYLQKAITLFTNQVVGGKAGGQGCFYRQGLDRLVTTRYQAGTVLINDLPLTSFNVVYPADATQSEQYLAEGIVDRLGTLTGKKPKLYTDATAYVAGTREILVGRTNREFSIVTTEGAGMEMAGNFIALVGSNSYELGLAKQYFMSSVVEIAVMMPNKQITVPTVKAIDDRTTVSMMAYNIYGVNGMVYQERADNFCLLINKYLPDILTFQEPAQNLMDLTYDNLEEYYEYYLGEPRHTASNSVNAVPIVDGNGNYKMEGGNIKMGNGSGGANSLAPILYAKNRFELVEGDSKWFTTRPDVLSKFDSSGSYAYERQQYCRMYTYVVLRDLQTDQELLVVNIHLDFNDALTKMEIQCMLKQLQEDGYNDLPIFLLGDFNSSQSASVMQMLLGDGGAGFKNVYNMGASVMSNPHDGSTIDWILTMPDCVAGVRYNKCLETYEDITADRAGKTYGNDPVHNNMPSDHPAVYAEVQILGNPTNPYDWSNVTQGINLTRDP